MPTLGEELKRRREERGISLNDISESTRIGTRFLKAIETDNFSILPGGIFTRSFIRAYAKQVGMNEDEAVGLYQQQAFGQTVAQQAQPQPLPTAERTYQPPPVQERPRRTEPMTYRASGPSISWPTIIITAGILLIVGMSIYALVRHLNRASDEEPAAGVQPQPAASQPAQQPEQQAQQPQAIQPGQPFVIRLEAVNGECWLQYEVDGQKGPPMTLKLGESNELPPAREIVKLNLGNRQALRVTINNREAVFPAEVPKTRAKLTFSPDNIQTFVQ
jgi:cytoskeletal protein RodZ